MRDPSKPIPGLSQDPGSSDGFHRVQADLQKPDTVSKAVQVSGAKRAFIYLAHGSADHMRGAIEALKAAGVEFVVFLSSFTIHLDKGLRDIPATDFIPYVHAQVEANLDDVFGEENYVALRAGAFASNLLQYRQGIAAGEVSMWSGKFEQDNIVPGDIGRVAGNILVSGPKNGQQKVYLYGPETRSVHDSVVKIGEILGKEVKIRFLSREEALKDFISQGRPEPLAKYMVEAMDSKGLDKPRYEEGVGNVELYTEKPATRFEDWVGENREVFGT